MIKSIRAKTKRIRLVPRINSIEKTDMISPEMASAFGDFASPIRHKINPVNQIIQPKKGIHP